MKEIRKGRIVGKSGTEFSLRLVFNEREREGERGREREREGERGREREREGERGREREREGERGREGVNFI
jgi:hypothetical protein